MRNYVVSTDTNLLFSKDGRVKLLRDVPDERVGELRALVASGDYFVMLATQLDQLSQQLAESDPSAREQLERVIVDLAFLHDRYEIYRK